MKNNQTSSIDQTIHRIQSFLEKTDLTNVAIAEMTGLSEAAIRSVKKNDGNPTSDTLRAIESVIPSDYQPPS